MGFPYCGAGWKGQRNQVSPPRWCLIPQAWGQVEQKRLEQGSPGLTLHRAPCKPAEEEVKSGGAGDLQTAGYCQGPAREWWLHRFSAGYEACFSPMAGKAWWKEAQGWFSFLGEPSGTVLVKPYFQRCWEHIIICKEQANTWVMVDKTTKCEGKIHKSWNVVKSQEGTSQRCGHFGKRNLAAFGNASLNSEYVKL